MSDIENSLFKRFGKRKEVNHFTYSNLIAKLCARSTCRDFIKKPLEEGLLEFLISASQGSPTSGKIQTYSVIVLETDDEKNKLFKDPRNLGHISGQVSKERIKESQNIKAIQNCSVFLIWIADLHRTSFILDHCFRENIIDEETLNQTNKSEIQLKSIIDTAILAQSFALCAESIDLGVMYCGAIRAIPTSYFEKEFNIPKLTFPLFGMAVGFPSNKEWNPIRSRLPTDIILHRGSYKKMESINQLDEYNKFHKKFIKPDNLDGQDFVARVIERLEVDDRKFQVSQNLRSMGFNFE
jgi:FMN reductase (NADPH)